MKKYRGMPTLLFAAVVLVSVSCGGADSYQGDGEGEPLGEDVQEPEETSDESENAIVLSEEILYLHNQPIERTWEKDYSSEEWEDGKCLNVYVMIPDMDGLYGQEIPEIEDELNHRLHMAGYDFYIHFMGPTYEEMYGGDPRLGHDVVPADGLVRQKRSEGIFIDIWVTDEYVSAVQNGEVLEITDFLQSGEGGSLYANYDACVWEKVMDGEGRIYGVPMNPVAAHRCVYSYTPQLMEQLSIDMSAFSGDPGDLEELFPALLQEGILPLELDMIERKDALMLSLFGLENYGGIIAVRHDGSDWEAVDLWEEQEPMAFYNRLGEWREKGFLGYRDEVLGYLKEVSGLDIADESGSSQYRYILFRLEEANAITWKYSLNHAEGEDGSTATTYDVPRQPVYISDQEFLKWRVAVISAQTEYPQECMQFLRILFTDPEIRLLLYKGIEGEHYIWRDDVLINGSAYGFPIGLGFSEDLRFWPVGDWGARCANEIADMNRNVSVGIGMTMPYELSEDPELSDREAACRRIIEENCPVFFGYYGSETARKLEEVHEQLVEAGYLELIEAVNANRLNE